jgi:hypothetical protein
VAKIWNTTVGSQCARAVPRAAEGVRGRFARGFRTLPSRRTLLPHPASPVGHPFCSCVERACEGSRRMRSPTPMLHCQHRISVRLPPLAAPLTAFLPPPPAAVCGLRAAEEDAYAWLVPLRVMCKDHNLGVSHAQGITRYVDPERRRQLVNVANRAGETPLHYAAKSMDTG